MSDVVRLTHPDVPDGIEVRESRARVLESQGWKRADGAPTPPSAANPAPPTPPLVPPGSGSSTPTEG